MSRDIKFRAWNKATNTMWEDILNSNNWSFSYFCTDVYIWMQYTGLDDKHGQGIYESDLVKDSGTLRKVLWFPEGAQFILQDINDDDWDIMWDGGNYEVVGNIYQNKDLLTA